MFEHLNASTAKMPVSQIRLLGGAASRVPSDATAYAHRGRRFMINLAALYEHPEEAATHEAWIARYASAINPDDTSAYVNFIGAEGPARVRDAYPAATWERLRGIKRQYDPANVFRLNQNIPPA
jgi:FAD/FMN-containing dehydrogenase